MADLIDRQECIDAMLKAYPLLQKAYLLETINSIPTAETDIYKEFALWVVDSIFEEDFDDNPGVFAEVACRKLEKMGLVKKAEGNWRYVGLNCGTHMEEWYERNH